MIKFIQSILNYRRPEWMPTGRQKIQKAKTYPSGMALWESVEEYMDLNSASGRTIWVLEYRWREPVRMIKPDTWEPSDPYNYYITEMERRNVQF